MSSLFPRHSSPRRATLRRAARSGGASALAWGLLLALGPAPVAAQARYPESRVAPVVDTLHGIAVTDDYRWLEDQQSADTRAWIAAQNRFREQRMAGVPGRDAIAARLRELLMVDVQGTPTVRGGRYFYTRRAADQDYSVVYMRRGPAGAEVAIIDPNVTAGEVPVSAGLMDIAEDGTLLAYYVRRGGEDEVVVRFYDVLRRRALPDVLPKARNGSVSITPDKRGFFFTRQTQQGPRLYYRALGAGASEQLLFGEGLGGEIGMGASLSRDGRWLIVSVSRGTSGGNDLYLMDAVAKSVPVPMVTGTDRDFNADFAGHRIVIETNWDAPRGRVFVATPDAPRREQWHEIVPEGPLPIAGTSLVGGRLWVRYLDRVVARVKSFDLEGHPFRELESPGVGTLSGLGGDWERDEGFFSFSSYNAPATVYRYSVARNLRSVFWRQSVPFDGSGFEVRQVWYTSKDGTRVPMFLAHRKGLALDGTNPVFLTAYGGFNISQTPGFSAQYALWMERGGVLAVPNLRGGGEFGQAWHEAGMFGRKQNVFDDFISAAEWLVANRYTTADRIAISGGSNGGLLVGAALTQRPDLFRAVVCSVPLLDMLRYERFLLGRFWVSEYGAATDSAQFRYLRAYSPYQNVHSGTRYPAVLFETGDGDTRVAPLHARKMTALLQATMSASIEERPILLKYDTEAGHSGGLPVAKTIDDTTLRLQFVMWQMGMLR
jgi:prolyl oligopeptidase